MEYDQYDIFNSPDLRFFCNGSKGRGLKDLVNSGMEFASPLELISLQIDFENKEDLEKLRKRGYETRAILLNKQSCIYNTTHSDSDRAYGKNEELIIVSPRQINTQDILYSDGSCRLFKLEDYNKFEKEALKIPPEISKEFITNHWKENINGVKNIKWKEEFLEFILEGNQKVIQDYIKYNESITGKPFFENFEISRGRSGNDGISPNWGIDDWNLLRIWSGNILEYSLDNNGKPKTHFPSFEFDDESNGIYHFGTNFIGISNDLKNKLNLR